MNTKIDKLKGHAEQLLQLYIALRKQYEYMAPMIFDRRVAEQFSGTADADVYDNLRINLYYLCVQDLANLLGDRCSRTPSVVNLMNELRDPVVLQALRNQSLYQPAGRVSHPVARSMLARENRRRKIAFGMSLHHLNRRWDQLSKERFYDSFRKVRDKIIAHAELQFDGVTYNRYPVSKLGLRWGNLRTALDMTEPIVFAIHKMITGRSFHSDSLYRSMRQSRKAFYNRWLLTSRCT